MKGLAPGIILFCALIAALASLYFDDSYGRMQQLKRNLSEQQVHNEQLREQVTSLKHEVNGIQNNDRELEKAARNELGMARPNEMIFIFDKEKDKEKKD